MTIQKITWEGVGSGGQVGGQGGCERRIEVFAKILFFFGGVVGVRLRGGGGRVDVNGEVKFL